jgi:hypothetical protein
MTSPKRTETMPTIVRSITLTKRTIAPIHGALGETLLIGIPPADVTRHYHAKNTSIIVTIEAIKHAEK